MSWKILGWLVVSCALVTGCATPKTAPSGPPATPREFRGVWVASVANIDWPSRSGLSVAEQQSEIVAILETCRELNLNAVIVQVRPVGDALYQSAIEPWSEFLTGVQGQAPNPQYDPLATWIAEGHKRGIAVHAWVNPFRVGHPKEKSAKSSLHISKRRPDLVRPYGDLLWLDPGVREAQDHALAVMLDIVRRYDIDGLHLDDYFYPYPQGGLEFPDDATYAQYRRSGGNLARDDWRRANIDGFVQRLYSLVKREKPHVLVGISPFGIWRPDQPPGIKGLSAYDKLYADSRKWFASGWVDYLSPQLYWKIDAPQQSYERLLEWWVAQNRARRHLWIGNFTSKIDSSRESWQPTEIVNQISLTRVRRGTGGNVHYSAIALMENRKGIADALKTSVYAYPAVIPTSPWLNTPKPATPRVVVARTSAGANQVQWQAQGNVPVRQWAVHVRYGKRWSFYVYPSGVRAISPGDADEVIVSAVDRYGNESERVTVNVRLPIARVSK
jgi:uncharacterized lipoprotein YddW (UPF0748 family)